MKFSKETTMAQPSNLAKDRPQAGLDDLINLDGVAKHLRVSRRYVQSLVRRKIIPVIRLGKRCTRFDLVRVRAAIQRYEIEEFGRK
jgi:hypothetical protein